MAKQKKQRRVRYETWPVRVSMKTHIWVITCARREHYTKRAAHDILVNRRLDELEGAGPVEHPAVPPVHIPVDPSRTDPLEVATQEILRNGHQARKVIVVSCDETEIGEWSEAELLCVAVPLYVSRHRRNGHLDNNRESLGAPSMKRLSLAEIPSSETLRHFKTIAQ